MKWPDLSAFPPLWTEPQRRVVFGGCVALLLAILLLRWARPMVIPDPQPAVGARAAELQDRVDPNTADAATLAAVPTLGESRARELVQYRMAHAAEYPDGVVFHSGRDFLKLKRFGVSTVQNVEPYLIFPPTTRP